jgi:hypothetical protein
MLDESIIGRLGADRVHLLIDSCNAYFMLSPRKAGAVRSQARVTARAALLDRYPHLGAVISTSAEALTYEWSELQSGIFSYLVRSGLRGAADADGDGAIDYRELAAFIDTATRDVVNEQYRPQVFARSPRKWADAKLLTPGSFVGSQVLPVPEGAPTRLTVYDRQGVRVLDLHSDGAKAARIILPDDAPFEIVAHTDGKIVRRELFARGESPVFLSLFQSPFGARAVGAFEEAQKLKPPPVYGISRRDTERLGAYLAAGAGFASELRMRSGTGLVVSAATVASVTASLVALHASYAPAWDLPKSLIVALGGFVFSVPLVVGMIELLRETPAERFSREYRQKSFGTEAERAQAVADFEGRLSMLAERERKSRIVWGSVWMVTGGVGIVSTGASLLLQPADSRASWQYALAIAAMCEGAAAMLVGGLMIDRWRAPSERLWQLHNHDEPAGAKLPPAVLPSLSFSPRGGVELGVMGMF